MNNVVDIENLRVDLGSYFLRGQAIDFWGKAFWKNTIATKGYINENSTGIRKEMGGERDRDREEEREEQRQKEGGRETRILYFQGWTNFLHSPATDLSPTMLRNQPTSLSMAIGSHTSLYKSYLGPTATQAEDQTIWYCSPYLAR